MKLINENIELAVARLNGEDPMAAATFRKNSVGNVVGRRMSFIQDVPAGDLKASLKAQGLKGKELKRQVKSVLAGNRSMAVASAIACIIGSAEQGFCPVRMDSNKAGDVRTLRMEEGNLTSVEVKDRTLRTTPAAELIAAAKAQLSAADAAALSKEDKELLALLGGNASAAVEVQASVQAQAA
jgi:hypothetical protein